MIDNVPTLIEQVRGNAARGFILQEDLTLRPCWIAKKGDFFAHGDSLKKATSDVLAKWRENRPVEERIAEFVKIHPDLDTPYDDLFEWHHILTGSCQAGRESWCRTHGYQPTDSITVRTFIKQTRNNYGGDIILLLAKEYQLSY